ncbi:Very-long-chain (3R)-3-hydroxyacyl-CoA dehydratase PASTICCINO 2A, partial [Mucuna pruriens]
MAAFFSLLRRLYLSLYNWAVLFQVLYFVLKTLKESGHEHVYNAAEKPLLFAQTAAVLELVCLWNSLWVFFNGEGLVRSPVTATLPQISSRLYLTWGILWSFPEIIRYSFFGFKETFGFTPSWLLWLRYSSFLVLYPTGISSEVGLIYIALPFIKVSEKYCIRMPNKWNSSFDYFYTAIVAMGIYSSHVHIHAFTEEESALQIEERVVQHQ